MRYRQGKLFTNIDIQLITDIQMEEALGAVKIPQTYIFVSQEGEISSCARL